MTEELYIGNQIASNGSSSPLNALAASPTGGADTNSSFGAAGKSSLLIIGVSSVLATKGSVLTGLADRTGDVDLPRALPIISCAFWE